MASFNRLLDLCRPFVRNCPDPVLTEWIIISAQDFCRKSRYLRDSFTIPTTAGQSYYQISARNPDEEIAGINTAQYGDYPLNPRSPLEVPQLNGRPYWYWYYPSEEIYIGPAPEVSETDSLAIDVFLQPRTGATTISDELILRFDQGIANGAIWRLFAMPGAGWANPDRIAFHQSEAERSMRNARFEADRQHRQIGYYSTPGF